MKKKTKILTFISVLLIFASGFSSCNEKEPLIEPFLNIDKTTITAAAEGEMFTIVVSSNGEWTAVVQDSWLALTNYLGVKDGVITVNIAENTLFETRSATIKISMGSLSEAVAVEQEAAERQPEGGYVLFKPCPCNEEMILWETQYFPRGEVFLFKDYITSGFHIEIAPFIVFNSDTNDAFLLLPSSYLGILGQGLVCNFPDFAKEWLNHQNGIRVYIEGAMYVCNFPAWGVTTFGYVLTSLKKK